MVILPVLFWFASFFLLALWVWEQREARKALTSRIGSLAVLDSGAANRPSRPSPIRKEKGAAATTARKILRALAPLSSRLPFPVDAVLIHQAGSDLSPVEFQSLRLLALTGELLLLAMMTGPLTLLLVLLPSATLAWILPVISLKKRIRRNQAAVVESLPTLLDLLSLLLLSGQGLQPALRKASKACGDPLRYELDRVFRAVEMGVPRQQALAALEERIPADEMRRFIRSVLRAERFGAPLADVVGSLAVEMRRDRRARLQERAHKAPVKILFPLVFMILPSFLLLTVGGMLLGGRIF